ncbi:CDP-alcohol phosphatidyltransferase family protein, partial [bacterium]
MNLPNKLTLLRIALTFVFMFCLFSEGPVFKVLALLVFSAAALTDLLDGIIAKARNQVTDFGKIMDPIADKIL